MGMKMGGPLKRGRQNLNVLATHARHMKFSGLANIKKSPPPNGALQNFNFLSFEAGHIKCWSINSQLAH